MADQEQAHWVIDFETMINCTVLVAEHYKTTETKIFVVHTLHNDFPKILDFLRTNIKNKERHISFNGLGFDSQISELILRSGQQLINAHPDKITAEIYKEAQDIITRSW